MKKRYNKLTAFLLVDFITAGIITLIFGIQRVLTFPKPETEQETLEYYIWFYITGIFLLIAIIITIGILRRTPAGERVATLGRALWLGFKLYIKIGLCFTLILIPLMLKWNIEYKEKDSDTNWNQGRKVVHDDDGNKYDVIDSGKYVKDDKGNSYFVWKSAIGGFIECNGERKQLK